MTEESVIYGAKRHLYGGIAPSNMKSFSIVGNVLTIEMPDDTVIDEQTLCTVDGVIICRKEDGYPKDEFDGFLINLPYQSGEFTWTDSTANSDDIYYYAAFPYSTNNVVNRNTKNRVTNDDGIPKALVSIDTDYRVRTIEWNPVNTSAAVVRCNIGAVSDLKLVLPKNIAFSSITKIQARGSTSYADISDFGKVSDKQYSSVMLNNPDYVTYDPDTHTVTLKDIVYSDPWRSPYWTVYYTVNTPNGEKLSKQSTKYLDGGDMPLPQPTIVGEKTYWASSSSLQIKAPAQCLDTSGKVDFNKPCKIACIVSSNPNSLGETCVGAYYGDKSFAFYIDYPSSSYYSVNGDTITLLNTYRTTIINAASRLGTAQPKVRFIACDENDLTKVTSNYYTSTPISFTTSTYTLEQNQLAVMESLAEIYEHYVAK